jgi:hypothetical protein
MGEKQFEANMMIIEDPNVEREIKASLILELVYHGEISLNRAKELFTETGIFSDHWMAIDGKATELFSKTISTLP